MQATTRRLLTSAGLVASITMLSACSSSSSPAPSDTTTSATTAGYPVTVGTGSDAVIIPARPTSIVSLSPTATEDLYAIGAGDQVEAVDKYSNYPAGTPMTKLSELQINVESLVALNPDLVIIANPSDNLSSRMKALSIPVLMLPAATHIDDVYTEMTELGEATGHVEEATKVEASVRAELQQITSSIAPRPKPLTYFFELGPDYYSLTSQTFVGQLLSLIGLQSIADTASGVADSGGYPQLSSEFIVKADPDFIFLADTICCQQDATTVAKRPGWTQIAAVKAGHVVNLSDDIASRWGPRIVVLLQTVADAVKNSNG